MKITEIKLKEGLELAEKRGLKALFVNDKGEFFTSQNMASNSVGNDKEKWAKVDLTAEVEKPAKGTNDLQKAVEVIAVIEAATEVAEVEAIQKAEAEGKNRVSVIEAAIKKIESLSNNAQ